MLGREEFEALTDKLQGKIRFLYFHLMGEPCLHPHLPEFIAIARRKGFVPVLTTNGTRLKRENRLEEDTRFTGIARLADDSTLAEGGRSIIEALPYKIQISLQSFEGNETEKTFKGGVERSVERDENAHLNLTVRPIEGTPKASRENETVLPHESETKTPHKNETELPYESETELPHENGRLERYLQEVMNFAKEAAAKGIIIVLRLWNQGGYERRNQQILDIIARFQAKPWTERHDGWKLSENLYIERDYIFEWPDIEKDFDQNETGASENIAIASETFISKSIENGVSEAGIGESDENGVSEASINESSENGVSESGESTKKEVFCYALRNQIGVLVDGSVVPCCLDHNGDIVLGNLFETDLETILASPRTKNIYEAFGRHETVEKLCQSCTYASTTKHYRKKA